MNIIYTAQAKADIEYWKKIDEALLNKINKLIENIQTTPFNGIGKPEPLKFDKSGYWSRRINDFHRLVYKLDGEELYIIQCRYHY